MAMRIDPDECTSCGDCKPMCPTGAIKSSKGVFRVVADICNECEDQDEPQCMSVCPTDGCIQPLAA